MTQECNLGDELPRFLCRDAIGPKCEVGIWLECGPVIEYLATRLWSEYDRIIVASSCNKAGDGNPQSDYFDLSFLDPKVRASVDFEISIPHWGNPEVDENGRWLSAPIWDMENERFIRKGMNQNTIARCIISRIQQKQSPTLQTTANNTIVV